MLLAHTRGWPQTDRSTGRPTTPQFARLWHPKPMALILANNGTPVVALQKSLVPSQPLGLSLQRYHCFHLRRLPRPRPHPRTWVRQLPVSNHVIGRPKCSHFTFSAGSTAALPVTTHSRGSSGSTFSDAETIRASSPRSSTLPSGHRSSHSPLSTASSVTSVEDFPSRSSPKPGRRSATLPPSLDLDLSRLSISSGTTLRPISQQFGDDDALPTAITPSSTRADVGEVRAPWKPEAGSTRNSFFSKHLAGDVPETPDGDDSDSDTSTRIGMALSCDPQYEELNKPVDVVLAVEKRATAKRNAADFEWLIVWPVGNQDSHAGLRLHETLVKSSRQYLHGGPILKMNRYTLGKLSWKQRMVLIEIAGQYSLELPNLGQHIHWATTLLNAAVEKGLFKADIVKDCISRARRDLS